MKLQVFKQTVMRSMDEEWQNILHEMDAALNAAVEDALFALQKQAKEQLDQLRYTLEIKKNKDIAAAAGQTRKMMEERRNSAIDALFDDVVNKLREFTASPAYSLFLFDKVYGCDTKKFIYLQVMDRDRELVAALPNLTVLSTEEDFIGGFRMMTKYKQAMVDYTFTSLLAEQRKFFSFIYHAGSR
jgi:vacuolar-type H+-ATPase subunit E/Vma4